MGFNYNQATLVGRLTKDPAFRRISDTPKANFTIAIDRPYRKDDGMSDTDFISIIAWGRLAEIIDQYLKKASPVLVQGRIQVRNYDKDGEKRWITEVVAENFQMLGNINLTEKNEDAEKKEPKDNKKKIKDEEQAEVAV